jgi:hypothetical protein
MFSGQTQAINGKYTRDTRKLRELPPVGIPASASGVSQPHWRQADTNAHI